MSRAVETKQTDWLSILKVILSVFNKSVEIESLLSYVPTRADGRLNEEGLLSALSRAGIQSDIAVIGAKKISHKTPTPFIYPGRKEILVVTAIGLDGKVEFVKDDGESGMCSLNELRSTHSGTVVFLSHQDDRGSKDLKSGSDDVKKSSGWFWYAFKRTMPIYSEVMVSAFLINVFALASPLFIMNVYDRVVPNAAFHTLWVLAVGMLIVVCFDLLMKKLKNDFVDIAARRIDNRLSSTMFNQILDIKLLARSESIGQTASVVQSFESIRSFITSASVSVLIDMPFVLLFLFVILLFAGALVVVPVVAVIVSFIVNIVVQIPLKKVITEYYQQSGAKQSLLIESLGAVECIKSQRAFGQFSGRWNEVSKASTDSNIRLRRLSNIASTSTMSIHQLATVALVIGGVYRIEAGLMTIGALIACTILTGRALAPISQAVGLFSQMHQAKSAYKSLDQVMKMPTEFSYLENSLSLKSVKGKIAYHQVNFQYPNGSLSALKEVSTTIESGEKVAIIGGPGSGKTTFIKLLLKLYEPNEGKILVDGLEIRQINTENLRRFIGYVPQDVTLIRGSVRDNITMGVHQVSDKQIVDAATISGLIKYVQAHPEGFNWQVGERGEYLSGGQRQAVALTRALLLDPPLLIFDEPTSDFDDSTAHHFINNLKTILPNKTLLVVTHKLSILQLVDRLLVFSAGQLVADGEKQAVLQRLKINVGAPKADKHSKQTG